MTQLLELHPTHPQKRLLEMAAKALHSGELVVYPNETGYAVACHVGDKRALAVSYTHLTLPTKA